MAKFAKEILITYLTFLAKLQILKINPKVISLTGSVGKTTLKDLLVSVFKQKYKIKYSKKSYNSEWGIPLTISH